MITELEILNKEQVTLLESINVTRLNCRYKIKFDSNDSDNIQIIEQEKKGYFYIGREITDNIGLTHSNLNAHWIDINGKFTLKEYSYIKTLANNTQTRIMVLLSEENVIRVFRHSKKPIPEQFKDIFIEKGRELMNKDKYPVLSRKQPSFEEMMNMMNIQNSIFEKHLQQMNIKFGALIEIYKDTFNVLQIIAEDYKSKQQLQVNPPKTEEVLPYVPELSYRDKLNMLIREYCVKYDKDFKLTWEKLYTAFYYHFGIDLKIRAMHRELKPLDVAEDDKCIDKLYALAKQNFKLEM